MPFAAIDEIIEDVREGRMIILVDDENRENEGDLCIAAEKVSPEAINFMIRFGRGLLCALLRGSDRSTVDLARTPNSRRLLEIAQSETVVDADIRQQAMSQRLRRIHFRAASRRSSVARYTARSSGNGASNRIGSPLAG